MHKAFTTGEQWLPQGRLGPRYGVSILGSSDNGNFLEGKPTKDLIRLVQKRLHAEKRPRFSVVIDEADFLPFSFYNNGSRQGLAVCRISRNFSRLPFHQLLDQMKEAIDDGVMNNYFESLEQVKEVFSIPDQIINEMIDEIKDFNPKSIKPLDLLYNLTDTQLANINPIPIGTGFLVGNNHLLTNHHVIDSISTAEQCVAQFNYVSNERGQIQQPIDYELNPSTLFVTEPELDYTLVQLKSGIFSRQAGDRFGWIQLIEEEENPRSSTPLF